MYKKLQRSILLIMSCLSGLLHAQQNYNQKPAFLKANSVWAFGENAGLDFNSGIPTAIITETNGNAVGFASVSDPITGALLFYTNGDSIWNANHQAMPNGYFSLGFGGPQSSLVVPVIDSPGKYYIFKLSGLIQEKNSAFGIGWTASELRYSVVDMTLDNGKGDIIAARKNIPLGKDSFTQSMIAIPDDNCNGIWLMVHSQSKSEFRAYHITENGIKTTPITSTTNGIKIKNANFMAISPDRKKMAISGFFFPASAIDTISNPLLALGEFNAKTGVVSNLMKIDTDTGGFEYGAYGICFSPNSSKLYVNLVTSSIYGNYIFQYDLNNFSAVSISSSKTYITSLTRSNIYSFSSPTALKLYKDTIYTSGFLWNMGTTVDCINKPDLSGAACDFQFDAIKLIPGSKQLLTLPNEVVFPLSFNDKPTSNYKDTLICSGWENGINIHTIDTNPGHHYIWSTGDTTAQIRISDPGIYWVQYYDNTCHYNIDTFSIKGTDLSTTITIKNKELGTSGGPFTSYQWLLNGIAIPGATQSTYVVTGNGNYQVIVTNEAGCIYTSEIYEVDNVGINESNYSSQIKVYPNPAQDMVFVHTPIKVNLKITGIEGKLIKDQSNATTISIGDLAEDVYLLHITDTNGMLLKIEKIIKAK